MSKKLVHHRKSAYNAQSGRCYYCDLLMWESDCKSFAQAHKISLSQAKLVKCTAEHLEARKDGGNDTKKNIVAACHCLHSGYSYSAHFWVFLNARQQATTVRNREVVLPRFNGISRGWKVSSKSGVIQAKLPRLA